MPVTIRIPTPLRRFVRGDKTVEVVADTVEAALIALAERSADLRRQLFDDQGGLRTFVNVFLGSENLRTSASLNRVRLRDGDELTILVAVAGGAPTTAEGLSAGETARYSRHLVMPEVGLEGQKRLKRARVLCVGAGGLGSPSTLYLAAAGVGTVGVVDYDVVDLPNIQRQILYSTEDVGRPKLDAACERLHRLNPEIEIVPHSVRLSDRNVLDLVRQYDIVVDGTDNYSTRYLINDACVLTGKPNVQAAVFRLEGQVTIFGARGGPCYRCLFPEPPPPGLVPPCAESGLLGVLPGILGAFQALEVLKLILGIGDPLVGRMVLFDALELRLRELPIHRSPDCAVCGDHPTILAPRDDTHSGGQ
jgi:molybdopterin/thiamine biosynthesis adenylyltransferase/molybdopterin converting factor small subunit